MKSLILGIESSCDECSASVVLHENTSKSSRLEVLSLATYSQIPLHQPYGGVVPEVASRNHLESIQPMIDPAIREAKINWQDLSAVAVTNRPGLVGALLVGVSTAKSLAYALQKPLIPVHHLEGHIASIFLDAPAPKIEFPMLVAVVSGGHTNLYVMKTYPELWPLDFLSRSCVARSRDDAAGEAFDKIAKLLGFSYPGGAWIDRKAIEGKGKINAFAFPRALPQKSVPDFSFSGLKTAAALQAEKLRKSGELESRLSDFCASVQEAIVDVLILKIGLAIQNHGCQSLAIVGGVSANSRLRARLVEDGPRIGLQTEPIFPQMKYATDNAAMIAAVGAYRFRQGHALQGEKLLTISAHAHPET
mgnify:CR=1 FL=1